MKKTVVGRLLSFWECLLSGAMYLSFGNGAVSRFSCRKFYYRPQISSNDGCSHGVSAAYWIGQRPQRLQVFLIPGITGIPIAIASMCGAFTYMNG